MDSFYEMMETIFRKGFGTGSEPTKGILEGMISGLLFGKKEKKE